MPARANSFSLRMRNNLENLRPSNLTHAQYTSGSGSGGSPIGIVLPDPDPYPSQPNVKKLFPKNFNTYSIVLSTIMKIMTPVLM
jgi:hypothetical protein